MSEKLDLVRKKLEGFLEELYGKYEKHINAYSIKINSIDIVITITTENNFIFILFIVPVEIKFKKSENIFAQLAEVNEISNFCKFNYDPECEKVFLKVSLLGEYCSKEEFDSALMFIVSFLKQERFENILQ
ncbi:MAG: hypothetical protein ABIM62_06750 [candidate division WOR-3 bacterium]